MAEYLTLDRAAMKDRSTSHLRIYVGNLQESAAVDDLYQHFIKYGQVNGIVINRGFGFVQFETEDSAQKAIINANGSTFQGKKLNVRTAQTNPDKPKEVIIHPEIPPAVALNDNIHPDDGNDSYDNYGNYIDDESQDGNDSRGGMRSGQRGGRPRSRVRSRGPRNKNGPGGPGFRDRSPLGPRGGDWADRDRGSYYPPPMHDYPPRALPVPERNDCEIIVVSKALTEYAEYIESRLKRLGIVVDLLFPMEDVPIGKVLGNIASRGCLYAILVMPQNQEHRSLTLTILHGLPQEHRNMPIEEALSLLSRNFQEARRGGSGGREAVLALLGQLADGRTITALQYEKVIEYLKEKKEQQVKMELGETTSATSTKTQAELQQRILSILNDKSAAKESTPIVPQPTPTQPPVQNKLLNDPTVQRALDSILQKFV